MDSASQNIISFNDVLCIIDICALSALINTKDMQFGVRALKNEGAERIWFPFVRTRSGMAPQCPRSRGARPGRLSCRVQRGRRDPQLAWDHWHARLASSRISGAAGPVRGAALNSRQYYDVLAPLRRLSPQSVPGVGPARLNREVTVAARRTALEVAGRSS